MKPIWKSKKAQTALLSLIGVIGAHYTGNEEIVAPIMTLGAILVAAFGAADWGKEAKALEYDD